MINTAIFGGSGFIGYYLLKELRTSNRKIFIYDIKPPIDSNDLVFYNIQNISNEELLDKLMDVNEIIDLAYTSNPKTSFDDPVSDILDNLPNTVRLLTLATNIPRLKKFIFISSGGTVYGNSNSKLLSEDHPTQPISPYGITKLAIEKYGLMFYHIDQLPFIIARPSNAYGIGQRINTGQGFIAQALNSILNKKSINIFGQNGNIRDYIYVTDIASAIVTLLDKGIEGEAYNIGTGIGNSNIEIINIIEEIIEPNNLSVKINFLDGRKFDVKSNVLDCSKIHSLGWHSTIPLEEGLKIIWDNLKSKTQ